VVAVTAHDEWRFSIREGGCEAYRPNQFRSASLLKRCDVLSGRSEFRCLRVLVVDDLPPNVKVLEARLAADYFNVVTANSGPEAIEIVRSHPPDIILLDVMMPDMDGFEVCRRLKSNPATHYIPVVIVSADNPPTASRLEAGADDFLTKPVDDMALFARVRSLVRLKMMTDELRMRAITSLEIGMEAPERSVPSPTRASAGDSAGRRPAVVSTNGWRRSCPPSTPSTSKPIRRKPFHAADGNYDLLIVSLSLENYDGLAAVQPGAVAGAHATADPRYFRRRQQCAAAARARNRCQRLSAAPGRQERIAGACADPDPQAALYRPSARQRAELDRDGDHRRADGPA
jgi:CheY-like chemotaxis protein